MCSYPFNTCLIYWELQSKGRSRLLIEEFFRATIAPVLRIPDDERHLNDAQLDDILAELQSVSPVKTLIAEEPTDAFGPTS